MLVGIPREIEDSEYRVGMVPASVAKLVHHGHKVVVQSELGTGIGITDDEYRAAGAKAEGIRKRKPRLCGGFAFSPC